MAISGAKDDLRPLTSSYGLTWSVCCYLVVDTVRHHSGTHPQGITPYLQALRTSGRRGLNSGLCELAGRAGKCKRIQHYRHKFKTIYLILFHKYGQQYRDIPPTI